LTIENRHCKSVLSVICLHYNSLLLRFCLKSL